MVVIINADCLEAMKQMDDNSVHSIVTDPPYGLSFMGKKWDYDVPSKEIWRQALRVLKPGGFLLSFAGSRTYHRMAVNIEDAGFEIRDQIMWIYGSGFPKSLNVAKAIDKHLGAERELIRKPFSPQQMMMKDGQNERPWQNKAKELGYHETASDEPASPEAKQWNGWGTALKPAHEPIVVARKPLIGTVVENVLEHGTGGINLDASRVGNDGGSRKANPTPDSKVVSAYRPGLNGGGQEPTGKGRFPANIILDEEAGHILDEQSGLTKSVKADRGDGSTMGFSGGKGSDSITDGHSDSGGASRFFKKAEFSEEELKPSHEPIVVARKPLEGTVAENTLEHGTGGINIDESRVKHDEPDIERKKMDSPLGMFTNPNREGERGAGPAPEGRFPANVIHDGSDEVKELFPNTKGTPAAGDGEGVVFGFSVDEKRSNKQMAPGYDDEGSAARYFKEVNFSKQEHEPIVLARKPIEGTVAENVLEHGVGGLNIDGCRVGEEIIKISQGDGFGSNNTLYGVGVNTNKGSEHQGRFPANVIHDGSEKVLEGFPDTKSGKPGIMRAAVNTSEALGVESRLPGTPMTGFGDSGSAARFFYCAKASGSERNAGIEEANGNTGQKGSGMSRICEFCGTNQLEPEACKCEVKSWVNPPKKNFHPTVKPIALMEYLCRMVTPKGGTVLDPFMGSGTTGIAALRLGFEFIGIEMSEEYAELAATRIAHWVDAELTFEDGEIVLTPKPQAEWL